MTSPTEPVIIAKDYPPHFMLQFGGYLGDDATRPEIWSASMRIMTQDANGDPKDQDIEAQENYLTTATAAIKSYWAALGTNITSQAKLTFVKCNAIRPDGKYLHETTTSVRDFAPLAGGETSSIAFKPYQIAAVVTLETSRKRGLGAKGRFYLPTPGGQVNQNGKWSGASAVAAATATLLDTLSLDDLLNSYNVAVVSGGGKFSAKGVAEPVRALSVGDVLDTQRSRRGALVETRSRVLVPGQNDAPGA